MFPTRMRSVRSNNAAISRFGDGETLKFEK